MDFNRFDDFGRYMSNTRANVTKTCANTVAMAAPTTSRRGKGPIPKIRRGSRIILVTSPIKFAFSGVLESPCAVYNPVNVWLTYEKTMSPQVMDKYFFA